MTPHAEEDRRPEGRCLPEYLPTDRNLGENLRAEGEHRARGRVHQCRSSLKGGSNPFWGKRVEVDITMAKASLSCQVRDTELAVNGLVTRVEAGSLV